MSAFALDKNYQQINFEEISVEELQIISGGSGGGGLSLKEGGLALIGLGIGVAMGPATLVGYAAFSVFAGTTMLVGSAAMG